MDKQLGALAAELDKLGLRQSTLLIFAASRARPAPWAYVQLGDRWYVREPRFKMNEAGELFDMRDAPFVKTPIAPASDTDSRQAAWQRFSAALTGAKNKED